MSHYEVTFTRREFAELLPSDVGSEPVPSGHVAGRALASLISAGTELSYGYTGEQFPKRSGYACVFRIEEVGEGVENLRVGDLALAMGEHKTHQVHPAKDVWLVPEGLSPQDATFARLMGVSMSTLTTTAARPPEKVVVTGLGPVGHLAAQIFQTCGYDVLGFDPDAKRCKLAEQGGIKHIAAQLPLDDPNWREQVALVLECSGHEASTLDGCRLVKSRGEVVLIGVPWRKRTDISAHELLHAIFHRYAIVRSGWEWEVPRDPAAFRVSSIRQNIEAALNWLNEGRIKIAVLYSTYDPRDPQAAYQALLQAQEKKLAIVFDWTLLD